MSQFLPSHCGHTPQQLQWKVETRWFLPQLESLETLFRSIFRSTEWETYFMTAYSSAVQHSSPKQSNDPGAIFESSNINFWSKVSLSLSFQETGWKSLRHDYKWVLQKGN